MKTETQVRVLTDGSVYLAVLYDPLTTEVIEDSKQTWRRRGEAVLFARHWAIADGHTLVLSTEDM